MFRRAYAGGSFFLFLPLFGPISTGFEVCMHRALEQ